MALGPSGPCRHVWESKCRTCGTDLEDWPELGLSLRTETPPSATGEYTPDQQRAADYIAKAGIGGGDDPVGFLIASHAFLAKDAARYRYLRDTAPWNSKVTIILAQDAADDIAMLTQDGLDAIIDSAMNTSDEGTKTS